MMAPSIRTLAGLAAVVLWSTNAWAADVALARMSLAWLLLVQYGTAAVALLAVRRARDGRVDQPPDRSSPGRLPAAAVGVVGLTGTVFLQYLAFALAPIVAANVLAYGWPLLAALWVAATVRTRRAVALAGLALLGFGGVALIFTSPAAGTGAASSSSATWGHLAALGSAVCMALYTLASSRMDANATDLLIPATLVGALAATALTASTHSTWPQPGGWLAAAYIGLGPMATGYGLWTLAMARGGAERLAPLGYATPLLSTLLLLATGAPATATTLAGVGLVLVCSIGVLSSQRSSPTARIDTVTADGDVSRRTLPGSQW